MTDGEAQREGAAPDRRVVQVMHPADNVATALRDLQPGELVRVERDGVSVEVEVRSPVPFGHKLALEAIEEREPVRKYGETIGLAGAPIARGEHVHVHNVESQRGRGDLTSAAGGPKSEA